MHHGFPVTAPARTLIDCAGRGPVERLLLTREPMAVLASIVRALAARG